MSELPSNDQLFLDIIGNNDLHDVGVAEIERQLLALQDDLVATYVGKDITRDQAAEIEDLEDKANQHWMFHDDIATISGKVYLAYGEFGELAELDGYEIEEDEWGSYFFAQDIPLRSHGIEIIPNEITDFTSEEPDTTLSGVRVGFSFSHAEDPHDRPMYTAFPGDLSRHTYADPTPAEARRQLLAGWPEIVKAIDTWVSPDMVTNLPRRLTLLARKVGRTIADNPRLKRLAEIYMNDEINFNQDQPYIATIENSLNVVSHVSDADEAEDDWQTLLLGGPLTLHISEPEVRFGSVSSSGGGIMSLYGQVYNDQDGVMPEIVEVQTHNITSLRSSRALRSLAERATLSHDMSASNGDETPGALIERIDESEATTLTAGKQPTEEVSPLKRRIEELRRLESAFVDACQFAITQQAILYPTKEEADRATRGVVNHLMYEIFKDTPLTEGNTVDVSGTNVQYPRSAPPDEIVNPEYTNGAVAFSVDKENPIGTLAIGETIGGQIKAIDTLVLRVETEDEADEGYRIVPVLMLLISQEQHNIAANPGLAVPLDSATRSRYATIPLVEDTEIHITELHQYEDVIDQMRRLKRAYPGSNLGDVFALERALYAEDRSSFTKLKHTERFVALEQLRTRLIEAGYSSNELVKTLDQMFSNRRVEIEGVILARNGQEYRIDTEHDASVDNWEIADVRDDGIDQLTFVLRRQVEGQDMIRYVAFSDITGFRY